MSETPALSMCTGYTAPRVGELVGLAGVDNRGRTEIVLVVDGSPDNSLDVCKNSRPSPARRSCAEPQPHFGEHNASWRPRARARRLCITMDDDLQNPPREVNACSNMRRRTTTSSTPTTRKKKHAACATSAAASPTGAPTD